LDQYEGKALAQEHSLPVLEAARTSSPTPRVADMNRLFDRGYMTTVREDLEGLANAKDPQFAHAARAVRRDGVSRSVAEVLSRCVC
jgi:hypothetical protein